MVGLIKISYANLTKSTYEAYSRSFFVKNSQRPPASVRVKLFLMIYFLSSSTKFCTRQSGFGTRLFEPTGETVGPSKTVRFPRTEILLPSGHVKISEQSSDVISWKSQIIKIISKLALKNRTIFCSI